MLPCPFHVYAVCTLAAGLPYTLLWSHMGSSSRSLLDLMHSGRAQRTEEIATLVVGVVGLVALLLVIR
jgi:phosphotransferase system  glucose/maltose/N-acetylglucosamine-specific IIC component